MKTIIAILLSFLLASPVYAISQSPASGSLTNLTLTNDADGCVNIDGGTLYVDCAANEVGVGTTAPGALLQLGDNTLNIQGVLRFEATDGDEIDISISVNDELGIVGGNVGIGTTDPGRDLTVEDGQFQLGGGSNNGWIYDSSDDVRWFQQVTDATIIGGSSENVSLCRGLTGIDDTCLIGDISVGGSSSFGTVTVTTITSSGEIQLAGTGDSWFTGSVGIGITNPTGRLNVVGECLRVGTGATADVTCGADDGFYEGSLEVDSTTRLDGALDLNSTANISGILTMGGGIQLFSRSITELRAITPGAVGETYFCNDCTNPCIVVSTGTSAANFAIADGGDFQ